ncbi:MAG: hypothetical protein ACJ74H_08300 [Thermoanaerobaculia bacterium]
MKHDANICAGVPARSEPAAKRHVRAAAPERGRHVLNKYAAIAIGIKVR